jgi:hypothetical protein
MPRGPEGEKGPPPSMIPDWSTDLAPGPIGYEERHPTPVCRSLRVRSFPLASPRSFISPIP